MSAFYIHLHTCSHLCACAMREQWRDLISTRLGTLSLLLRNCILWNFRDNRAFVNMQIWRVLLHRCNAFDTRNSGEHSRKYWAWLYFVGSVSKWNCNTYLIAGEEKRVSFSGISIATGFCFLLIKSSFLLIKNSRKRGESKTREICSSWRIVSTVFRERFSRAIIKRNLSILNFTFRTKVGIWSEKLQISNVAYGFSKILLIIKMAKRFFEETTLTHAIETFTCLWIIK